MSADADDATLDQFSRGELEELVREQQDDLKELAARVDALHRQLDRLRTVVAGDDLYDIDVEEERHLVERLTIAEAKHEGFANHLQSLRRGESDDE